MSRTVVSYPHPVLARKARPVVKITEEIRALAVEMAELMYAHKGVGLAAPQVAESLRLITVDLSGPEKRDELLVFVNPVISNLQGEVDSEEGCLSVAGDFRATVSRAEKLRLSAQDLDGKTVNMDADGLLAICLQHEIDHLDGCLFIDKISRLKRAFYERKLKKWQKQKN